MYLCIKALTELEMKVTSRWEGDTLMCFLNLFQGNLSCLNLSVCTFALFGMENQFGNITMIQFIVLNLTEKICAVFGKTQHLDQ